MFNLIFDEDASSPAEYSIILGVTFIMATAMVVGVLGDRLQSSFQRVTNLFPE